MSFDPERRTLGISTGRPLEGPQVPTRGPRVSVPKGEPKKRRGNRRSAVGTIARTLAGVGILTTGVVAVDQLATDSLGITPPGHELLAKGKDTGVRLILEKGPALEETFKELFGKTPAIPESYNPNAEYGIAKGGWNTVSVSEDKLSSLLRNAVKSSPDGSTIFYLLLPAKLGSGERAIYHIGSGGTTLTLPEKGTEIVLPVVEAEVFRRPLWYVEGVPYFNGFFVRFNAPDGTPFEMTIYSQRDARELVLADIVENAPIIEERSVQLGGNRSTIERIFPQNGGIRVKGGEVIASTGLDYAEITLLTGSKGPRKPLHFMFLTGEDNGNLKIVTPQ